MTKEEFWNHLSGKQQWDVLVALRGPDIKRSEAIKAFTTSVIRNAMSGIIRVGGQISDLGFVLLPGDKVFKRPSGFDSSVSVWPDFDHFVGHVYEAAEILGIPIIQISGESWEAIALSNSTGEGLRIFCNYVKNVRPHIPPEAKSAVDRLFNRGYGMGTCGNCGNNVKDGISTCNHCGAIQ